MATKGTRTRRKIIEKSMQLFSVKGYYNTSIADILAAADLTKGGLYGHFASKRRSRWYLEGYCFQGDTQQLGSVEAN
jgi:AcrR family transcriptional regulator